MTTAAPAKPMFARFATLGTGVTAGVSGRHGGYSQGSYATLNLGDHVGDDHREVAKNRQRICELLGIRRLTIADQQHGTAVAQIDARHVGAGHLSKDDATARLAATDGLVTDIPGVALTILVADCQPIVFWDPARSALGVAHAGRASTVDGIVPAVIAKMTACYGTDPANLRVGIGPHIGADSYEVGPAEAGDFNSAFPGLGFSHPTLNGKATLDLEGAARHQLAAAGVPPGAVESFDIDTLHATDQYFSDRATRPCGRFALIAWIHERP